jgi:hypothetical protein
MFENVKDRSGEQVWLGRLKIKSNNAEWLVQFGRRSSKLGHDQNLILILWLKIEG